MERVPERRRLRIRCASVACRFGKLARSRAPTGDEVADFLGRFAVDGAFTPTHAHGGEASPEFAVPNIVQILDRVIRARFRPAMGVVAGRDGRNLMLGKLPIQ